MVGRSGSQRWARVATWVGAAAAAVGLGAGLLVLTPAGQAAASPQIVATVNVPGPQQVAVDSKTGTALVTGAGTLSAVNETTRSVAGSVPLPAPALGSFQSTAVSVDPTTGLIYVNGFVVRPNNNGPGASVEPRVLVFAERTLWLISSLAPTCTGTGGDIGVDSNTGTVYFPCYGGVEEVKESTIDPHKPKTQVLNVPGNVETVRVDQTTGTLYATAQARGSTASYVAVISEATKAVTATVPTGNNVGGLAIDPDEGKVYAAHDHGAVSVIDEKSSTVTRTIGGLSGAAGVAADPVSEQVFVTDGTHQVSVIDEKTGTVSATLSTGTPPPYAESDHGYSDSVAANSATGMAYVVGGSTDNVPNEVVSIIK